MNETPPSANPNGADLGDLRARAGLFFDEKTGQPLRIAASPNGLTIPGSGPLTALAADRFKNQRSTPFFMSEAEFEIRFLSADRIELKTKEGIVSHYRRAQAWTPTADDLKALAGRYQSEELLATFDATPTKDGLNVRANQANTIEFKPAEKDTFQIGQIFGANRNTVNKACRTLQIAGILESRPGKKGFFVRHAPAGRGAADRMRRQPIRPRAQ